MALLWNPESWSQRLAELEAQTGDLKEAPLRRDVRSLGTLLGAVLREQAGEESFAQVEALRQGTIARRDAEARGNSSEASRHAAAALNLVHSLPVDQATLLTRAFAFYFELINLAETNHRKRRRMALQLSGRAGRQRGSLVGTLSEMRRVGISADEALDYLRRVLVVPVFTAHPTEAARRTVMFKRRRIGDFLAELDRIPLPAQEMARIENSLLAEITSLWQTDEIRSRRPTVYDEVKMGLDYYDVSIFATLPALYREIAEALKSAYDLYLEPLDLPVVLRFGSWIGGDRDGNPFVTPQVTRDALQLARGHLLLYYQHQLDNIIDLLTTSAQQRPVSKPLLARLRNYVALVQTPEAQVFGAQYEFEYYRRFVICLKARIQRTLENVGDTARTGAALPVMPYTLAQGHEKLVQVLPPYGCAQEFLDDLEPCAPRSSKRRHSHRAHPHRSAAPAGPHLGAASAHPRYPPARACARSGAQGSRSRHHGADSAGRALRGNRERARNLPRSCGDQERLRAGSDSPVRHQRRSLGRRRSGRGPAGAAGRRKARGREAQGRQRPM